MTKGGDGGGAFIKTVYSRGFKKIISTKTYSEKQLTHNQFPVLLPEDFELSLFSSSVAISKSINNKLMSFLLHSLILDITY